MKTTPDSKKLIALVNHARKGRLVLPQFQRNFVWSASEIIDLLVSIMQGYYIGTFLLLRTAPDDVPFAVRPLEGIEIPNNHLRPEKIILDGQQRLTSLNYVFTAPPIPLRWTKYPYRFFLNLERVARGDIEDAVWCDRADRCDDWLDQQKQFDEMQLPFTEIERWDEWLKGYELSLRNKVGDKMQAYWQHVDD